MRVISVPSIKLRTSVYLPQGEPENNIFIISSLNSQTCLPPPNPSGVESNLFLVYVRPPSPTSNGCTADTAREKAECLNSMFASKYCVRNSSLSVPTLPSCTQLSLVSVSFSSDKVEIFLSNLDSDSPTSPDGISPHVLKTCSSALVHPLFVIFTLSFSQGHLPSGWKSANITALHKKGAKIDPCNCRPNSLHQQGYGIISNHQQGYGIHHRFRH